MRFTGNAACTCNGLATAHSRRRIPAPFRPGGGGETFDYDIAGNRTRYGYTSATQGSAYDVDDILRESGTPYVANATGNTVYEHDDNGNLTVRNGSDGNWTYDYDVRNRLTRVTKDGAEVARYRYDPFNRRLWKDVTEAGVATRTWYHYCQEGLLGEYARDAQQNIVRTKGYGYLPGSAWGTNPLYLWTDEWDAEGAYYWYLNDHLGTPKKLVDGSGLTVWEAEHKGFGEALTTLENVQNNLRFPGQYYDAETGLHYNWNRYYDPATGRYLTEDPLMDGANWYGYVNGRPVVGVDAEGLFGDGITESEDPYGSLGHSDFPGADRFNFTKEDRGITGPLFSPWRHFRDRTSPEFKSELSVAIRNGDQDAFERLMHQGQDSFSHFDKGYTPRKHVEAGTAPDEDNDAWRGAASWTQFYVDLWDKVNSCSYR